MSTKASNDGSTAARLLAAIQAIIDLIRNMKPERIQNNLLPPEKVNEHLARHRHWTPAAITREVEFASFADTVGFVNSVAAAAAALDHYPTMIVEKNRVKVFVTTPGVGLTEADFALAARIDALE